MSEAPLASFLGLPPELRVRIYELALDEWTPKHSFRLDLRGSADGQQEKRVGGPFALPSVCRTVYREVVDMLPPIGSIVFFFDGFTCEDMRKWLDVMGEERVSQMRSWYVEGFGECLAQFYKNGHWWNGEYTPCPWHVGQPCDCGADEGDGSDKEQRMGLCWRGIKVGLTTFEADFANGEFDDPEEALRGYKYVKSHWCGQDNVRSDGCADCCYSALRYALYGMVSPEGRLTITKAHIMDIFDALGLEWSSQSD